MLVRCLLYVVKLKSFCEAEFAKRRNVRREFGDRRCESIPAQYERNRRFGHLV